MDTPPPAPWTRTTAVTANAPVSRLKEKSARRGRLGIGRPPGRQDAADYVLWRKIMSQPGGGNGAESDGSGVPEPEAVLLLSIALSTMMVRPRTVLIRLTLTSPST